MLNISQFARECNTTVKTIRHYDNIGLLMADYVSEESGYRYYRRQSVAKYRQIQKLKQSGFTLKEIKENFSLVDLRDNMNYIEQKILLLKKQQEICENVKKEYEKIMAESKKVIVSGKNDHIELISADSKESFEVSVNSDVLDKCAELLDFALNENPIIGCDFNDLKDFLLDKKAFSVGKCYSPDFSISVFDNVDITSEEEKATSLIVLFEASPDSSVDIISEAIGAFMMAFADEVDVMFIANGENGERGLNLHWICLK